jgi:hypothetical protein
MRRVCPSAVVLLLFFVLPSRVPAYPAAQQDENNLRQPPITAADAQRLETSLRTNPDDAPARKKLIVYYFTALLTAPNAERDALEDRHEQHIFWLIQNQLESGLAGSPYAEITPGISELATAGYKRGKQLWLDVVQSHTGSPRILLNAAQFISFYDRKLSQQLLQKALALAPSDETIASQLANSYMIERQTATSPDDKAGLAANALAVEETTLSRLGAEQRFYVLADLAVEAFEAGDTAKATQYASELLRTAEVCKGRGTWNYGNAIHKGNIVLGRIALERGDTAAAKQHLLAAGETPGSPQLDSFGPNMSLAKELIEKDERDTVIAYLEACKKFWEMDNGRLQNWIATTKGGGMPDFGANLVY